MLLSVTLMSTLFVHLQMTIYLELMRMRGGKNDGYILLWQGTNTKVSVSAPYVVGKHGTDVFTSVSCDTDVDVVVGLSGVYHLAMLCPYSSYTCGRAKSV